MMLRSRIVAENHIHSFGLLLFTFSTFTSTARLDYNCAFGLLTFFFVKRKNASYSFNLEQCIMFFWLCVFSCVIDLTWISIHANAGEVYDHSVMHKLASTVRFVTSFSIIEFLLVKIPFVVILFLVSYIEENNTSLAYLPDQEPTRQAAQQPFSVDNDNALQESEEL
jgi:hypothetical protein